MITLKKKTSQKGIEDLVVEYYRQREEIHCLEDVFTEWIDEKLTFGEIQK